MQFQLCLIALNDRYVTTGPEFVRQDGLCARPEDTNRPGTHSHTDHVRALPGAFVCRMWFSGYLGR